MGACLPQPRLSGDARVRFPHGGLFQMQPVHPWTGCGHLAGSGDSPACWRPQTTQAREIAARASSEVG